MKKFLAILFTCFLLLGLLPGTAYAATAVGVGNTFNTTSGMTFKVLTESGNTGTVELVSYTGTYDILTIPSPVYNGVTYTVTDINKAFMKCTSLKEITISEGVTSLDQDAFWGCTSLEKVTILGRVTSIGNYAFYECTSLTSVTIPDSVTSIGSYAFYKCTSLTSIAIPDSVTSIGNNAFSDCTSLTGITIPDSVTSIRNHTFSGCTGLTGIDIPDGVTSIGSGTFYNCESLTSVTIPDSVTDIGSSAFSGCTKLTSITIPDGVTQINATVFYGCTSLTGITIPASVTNINSGAFSGCAALKTAVLLTDELKNISSSAFNETTADVIHKYVAPTNLRFDGTTARWDPLKTDYVRYKLVVSQVATSPVEIVQIAKTYYSNGSSCDLSDYMTTNGTYKVSLSAVLPEVLETNRPAYVDSDEVSVETKYPQQLEISDTQATRTGINTAEVSFNANMAGTMYYMVSAMAHVGDPTIDTTGNGIAVSQGTNTFSAPLVSGAEPTQPQFLYVTFKTADGVVSNITCITIPAYSGTTYKLTATAGAGGSISPASEQVPAGGSAVFTITPISGYELEKLTLDGTDVTSAVSNDQYTISNVQAAHTLAATFKLIPTPTTHEISVESIDFSAEEGYSNLQRNIGITNTGDTSVTIHSVTLDGADKDKFTLTAGQGFTINAGANNFDNSCFIKPNKGLSVGSYSATITVTYGDANGGTETATAPVTFTVEPTCYDITVQTEGSGTASASPATAAQGTKITLTATPGSGCRFKEWVVVSGGVTISGGEFTMPDSDVTVKAVFEADSGGQGGGQGGGTRPGGQGSESGPTTIQSPATFDAGVAVYGLMALASALGAAYVSRKKK